jgi:hypothetical protein
MSQPGDTASWQLVLTTGGAVLGRALTDASGRRITAGVGGSVVVLLALQLAVSPG